MASVLLVSFLSLAGAGFAHPSAPLITPAPVVGRQSINVAVPEFCEKKSQVSSCFDRLGAQEKLDECQGSKDDTCLCAGYAAVDACVSSACGDEFETATKGIFQISYYSSYVHTFCSAVGAGGVVDTPQTDSPAETTTKKTNPTTATPTAPAQTTGAGSDSDSDAASEAGDNTSPATGSPTQGATEEEQESTSEESGAESSSTAEPSGSVTDDESSTAPATSESPSSAAMSLKAGSVGALGGVAGVMALWGALGLGAFVFQAAL